MDKAEDAKEIENIVRIERDIKVENDIFGEEQSQEEAFETRKKQNIDKLLQNKDIKYRGIFSGRAMKIIGFVLMFFAQVYLCIKLVNNIQGLPESVLNFGDVMLTLSYFALPMFLSANFCIIMTSKTKIKKTVIVYSIIAISIFLLVLFFFSRYMIGIGRALNPDNPSEAYKFAETITKGAFGKIINYNVFVDLALFSLFYFFLFYNPKKIEGKKSVLAFRLCCIIPVIFAVISAILYGLYNIGEIDLPVAVLAILPCRSFTIYAIFFGIAFIIKLRQYLFTKWGGTQEEYELYAKSNRSSLEISIVSSIIILVVCLVDFILFQINPFVVFFGIGFNYYYAFSIPLIMLLSYTRNTKSSIWDYIMIAIFVFAVIILYLETGLFIISNA